MIVIISLVCVFFLITSWFSVPPGEIGIKYNLFTGSAKVYSSGWHLKLPVAHRIERIDGKIQKITYDEETYSRDMQQVNLKVSVNYNVDSVYAVNLFSKIGRDYEEVVITPAVRNEIKTSIAKYNIENIMENRDVIKKTIEDSLTVILSSSHIALNAVNIEDIKFNPKFQKAVEEQQIQSHQLNVSGYSGKN